MFYLTVQKEGIREPVRAISPKSKLVREEVEFLTNTPVQKFGCLAEILTTGDTHYF